MNLNWEGALTFEFPDMDSETRMGELILHISDKCFRDPTFGKIKLVKIMFFADFMAYQMHGEPITGARYIKLQNGPIPSALSDILKRLENAGDIVIRNQPIYDFERQRVISLRPADLTNFNARDIALVDDIIIELWGARAKEVSELSHGMAWKVTELKKPIPYEASLLSDEDLTQEDVDHIQELIAEYGIDP